MNLIKFLLSYSNWKSTPVFPGYLGVTTLHFLGHQGVMPLQKYKNFPVYWTLESCNFLMSKAPGSPEKSPSVLDTGESDLPVSTLMSYNSPVSRTLGIVLSFLPFFKPLNNQQSLKNCLLVKVTKQIHMFYI